MSSKQINKHPCTEERNYQMKLGRRNTYMKITADKKEVMLLQRRTNELQLQKSNPPIEPVVDCAVERTRLHCDPTSSKQTALAIREPSLANIQEHACYEVNTLSRSSDKGKNIFQPFCVFEKGSTSNASTGQQNVTPEIVTNKVMSISNMQVDAAMEELPFGRIISRKLQQFDCVNIPCMSDDTCRQYGCGPSCVTLFGINRCSRI
ncbi:uncharacterized protein LOC132640260 isoform X5 [Lycium barbarum]|uniref:uncharacterized protein LOC132640260 isoform X5 n=1 Tax=Lycium barbarum TaxID=112863 RepID=UPI00293E756F|nr:uncharacterized protein LOC132640260 isoform X5 [Lycium barbarum]